MNKKQIGIFVIGAVIFIILIIFIFNPSITPNSVTPTTDDEPQTFATAWQSGDLTTAQLLIDDLLRSEPNSASLNYQKGILELLNDPDQGLAWLQQATQLDSTYQVATNTIQNAILIGQANPDLGYQKMLLGQALAGIGEWSAAEFLFQQVTEINPTYPEAWGYLGEAQQQNGKDGLVALSTAYELNPEALVSNLFLGLYWRRQAQPEGALTYIEKANQLAPNTPEIQIELGQILAELGQVNEALATYQTMVETTPNKHAAWLDLAKYSIENELFVLETGLPAIREAYQIAPDDSTTLQLFGRAYAILEEPLLAERFYQRSLEIEPQNSVTLFYFGLLNIAEGKHANAQEHLQRALNFSNDPQLTAKIEAIMREYFP